MVKRPASSVDHDDNDNDDNNGGVTVVRKIDPLIRSLLHHLPKPGDVWPSTERENWVNLLEGAFKVIYKEAEQEKIGGAPRVQPTPGSVRTP